MDGGVGSGFGYARWNRPAGEVSTNDKALKTSSRWRIRIGQSRIKRRSPAEIIAQLSLSLISESQIQRQSGSNPVVVLCIEIAVPHSPFAIKYSGNIDAHNGVPHQQSCKRRLIHPSHE